MTVLRGLSSRTWALLFGLTAALTVTGCKADLGDACDGADACADALTCHAGVCVDPAAHCQGESACQRYGECTLVDGVCAVASEADCRKSERCSKLGKCTFVAGGPCCSRDSTCPPEGDDPLTHLRRLDVAATRGDALAALLRLQDDALRADGDETGTTTTTLMEEVTAPVAQLDPAKLSVAEQADRLKLLARGRHPAATASLVAALAGYAPGAMPTPVDAVMGDVALALAELGAAEARAPLFALFQRLQASSRAFEAGGLGVKVGRAVVALADPGWTPTLTKLLGEPLDPDGDLGAFRDGLHRQRVAALALGAIGDAAAIEPLVAAAVLKADVAPAATSALAGLGEPAAEQAKALVAGSHPLSGQAESAAALAEPDRAAPKVRLERGAVLLARIGRPADRQIVLDALAESDDFGKARIAIALAALPPNADSLEAFTKVGASVPLDLEIDREHRGVAAMLSAAPRFFAPELTIWLVETAQKMQGTDTGLAPFREPAMHAAMLLMTHSQHESVAELGALITEAKWRTDYDAAVALTKRCQEKADCYLEALAAAKDDGFASQKAAVMASMYSTDAEPLAKALMASRDSETRRLLAFGLGRAGGDAALADRLTKAAPEVLHDPVVREAIARLRNR